MLISPECSAPACHHDGDHYTMIKCRSCGRWFCEEHIETAQEQRSLRLTQVPTVKLVEIGAHGLAYYLGYCSACRETAAARHGVDSTWLR